MKLSGSIIANTQEIFLVLLYNSIIKFTASYMDLKVDAKTSPLQEKNKPTFVELLKKKETLYSIAAVIGGLIIVAIIGYVFIFPRNEQPQKNADSQNNQPTPTPTATMTPTPEEEETDKNRIAFITGNNVWIVNPDGSGKMQITTDGGAAARYSSLDWKLPGQLSYVKCAGSCAIVTYSLKDKKETVEVDIPNSQSAYIRWNHTGTMLAYYVMSSVGDNANFILRNGSGTVSIKTFAFPGGRGVGYNDDLEIHFSPDNTKVAYTNTFFGEDTIYVYDNAGKELTTVKANASFGRMMKNNALLYVDKGTLLQKDIPSNKLSTIGKLIGYELIPSLDNQHYYFWKLNETSGIVSTYWNKLGGTEQKVAENFMPLEPISETEVAGYLTKPVTNIDESITPYDFVGLGKVSNDGKVRMTLHANQVYEVAVE